MANRKQASKKRIADDETKQAHRQEERKDLERRYRQNLTQRMNTGTQDVQRISDWGTTRPTKKRKK
jgi:hypothetical protein